MSSTETQARGGAATGRIESRLMSRPSLLAYLFYAQMGSGDFETHVWLEAQGSDPVDALINLAAGYGANSVEENAASLVAQVGSRTIEELINDDFKIETDVEGVIFTIESYMLKPAHRPNAETGGFWAASSVSEYSLVRLKDGRIGIITNTRKKRPLVVLDGQHERGVQINAGDQVEIIQHAADIAFNLLDAIATQPRTPERELVRRLFVAPEKVRAMESHGGHELVCVVYGERAGAGIECNDCDNVKVIEFDNDGGEESDFERLAAHEDHEMAVCRQMGRTIIACKDGFNLATPSERCRRPVFTIAVEGEEVFTIEDRPTL
jgi:hypothetical protein